MKLQMKVKILSVASLAAVAVLASANMVHAAVIDLGSPFTPAGANYTITAVQGIDAANPLGNSGLSPTVNQNFEFPGVYGVNYQNNAGGVSQGGLSLYNNGPGGGIQSTGLRVDYNTLVSASSVNITVEDFDIKNNTAWGSTSKARPNITLLGAGGVVIGTATPDQVLPNLVAAGGGSDIWNVNLGGLLSTMGLANQSVSGYLLSAANYAGNVFQGPTTDDPYLLVNAGNGIPVIPETSSFLPLLGVLGVAMVAPKLRRKRQAAAA